MRGRMLEWRSPDARCVALVSERRYWGWGNDWMGHECKRPRKNHVNASVPLCGIHMRASTVFVEFPNGVREWVKVDSYVRTPLGAN